MACARDIVLLWAERGVRVFRVDNPHTKPLAFWEWLIREVQDTYPDTIFLAEAFTRPSVMKELAKLGFTQSYTYFTWRNTKSELQDYLTELTQTEMREYFRGKLLCQYARYPPGNFANRRSTSVPDAPGARGDIVVGLRYLQWLRAG